MYCTTIFFECHLLSLTSICFPAQKGEGPLKNQNGEIPHSKILSQQPKKYTMLIKADQHILLIKAISIDFNVISSLLLKKNLSWIHFVIISLKNQNLQSIDQKPYNSIWDLANHGPQKNWMMLNKTMISVCLVVPWKFSSKEYLINHQNWTGIVKKKGVSLILQSWGPGSALAM